MPHPSDPPTAKRESPREFVTTSWTLVASAGQASSAESQRALETLCENYWYPLYAFVRHRGHAAPEAQDLTQSFFARLLEGNAFQLADRERGKFRTFLLTALQNFLNNEWRNARAEKRGGGQKPLHWNFISAEERWQAEPADLLTPERIFERRWAMTLLDRTLTNLAKEYRENGKQPLFEQIRGCLGGEGTDRSYREIGESLEMSEGAIKVAVHRLRQRCREILRNEISATVTDPNEIDDELRTLFRVVSE